ncbi:unnamed protein product [Orchesella dallaii]|uniref:mRNA-decapping enzyme C-terminal domain-containing protein n=1 Tax=Orchesella dallaii TaxID=48710 RepID=A0ABP1PML4_9HEXA
MSQPNNLMGTVGLGGFPKAISKPRRPRTNSQGQTPQKSQSPFRLEFGNGGGGGGGGSARKNKSHSNYQPQLYNLSTPGKVIYNSSKTAELQCLLNTLPSSSNNHQIFFDASSSDFYQQSQNYSNQHGGGSANNYDGSSIFTPHLSRNSTTAGAVVVNNVESNTTVDIVNDEESNRLNSMALRRIDTAFSKLHGTASQVAIYRYNPTTQSWDKTDTVGCLFLYERNIAPKFGLVVMNRKSVSNFIQCFGPDGQVVLNTPFLLLRAVEDLNNDPNDGTQAIHCIWFYDGQECVTSANILKNMGLKFEDETLGNMGFGSPNDLNKTPAGKLCGNTLFQILQRGSKESPQPKGKSMAKVMTAEELESQMLHESDNSHQLIGGAGLMSGGQVNGGSLLHQFLNISMNDKNIEPKTSGQSVTSDSPSVAHVPLTQNKMRTVEQLEREMRKERSSDSSTSTGSASAVAIQNELMQTLGIPNMTAVDKTDFRDVQSGGYTASPFHTTSKSIERTMLDTIVGKSVEETDPEDLRQVLQNIEPSNLILVTETVPGANESRLTWRINRSSSLRKENDSTFTTPTGEFVSATGTRCSSQLGSDPRYFEGSGRALDIKPSPLTKDQFAQTLIYLLQSDTDFITKIHDAYIKSLQDAFDGRHF